VNTDTIYRENIMEHYKNPRNHGRLENADITFTGENPLCGDKLVYTLKIDNKILTDIMFEGTGCAISQAASSMLTEKIKNLSVEEIKAFERPDILDMLKISIGPVRTKCAILGLVTVKCALDSNETEGSIEVKE